jgi:hypothetical protein
LTRNLGVPAAALANLLQKEMYIGTGKVPPPTPASFRNAGLQPSQLSHEYRLGDQPEDNGRYPIVRMWGPVIIR